MEILSVSWEGGLRRPEWKTLCFALVSAFFLWGVAAALAQAPASRTGLAANPVFEKNCARCHGSSASGRFLRAPSLVSAKAASVPSEELRATIMNGKGWFPLHRMPKFSGKLTAQEIDALVGQIRTPNAK